MDAYAIYVYSAAGIFVGLLALLCAYALVDYRQQKQKAEHAKR